MSIFSFEQQYVFYGVYHRQKWNVLIHMVFVPIIVWTIAVWLSNTGELVSLPFVKLIPPYHGWVPEANGAFFGFAALLAYYMILDPFATLFLTGICVLMFVTAGHFAANVPNHNLYALYAHVTGWTLQIFGHYYFEGRSPAFTESLWQAVVVAPLFVWSELLFALGYKPDMVHRLDAEITKMQAIKFGTGKKDKEE
ncbi:hypothetical protein AMAG_07476 [Allomyces macrogynus ATCC 38327]|uniref:DUF962 domain-containing protein n=2 Tax=Allomyces macrogynus (strain ATCC 38327) TaxID=578462 RepID=A0A0L0SIA1_ALLM3|nr:hypothetical protein AMAG_07476 [Allomyces macrogynus ATCC 38327]|eukprot:KNE62238.1 hypothetical protein AMAG_07476 [Allomyces macrogynus ATCC 38327]